MKTEIAKDTTERYAERTKVIATDIGFWGGARRRVGDRWTVPAGEPKAKWFRPETEADAAETDIAGGAVLQLLDNSIPDILDVLPSKTSAELRQLRDAEQGGKTRRGLLSKIEDLLANRAVDPDNHPEPEQAAEGDVFE